MVVVVAVDAAAVVVVVDVLCCLPCRSTLRCCLLQYWRAPRRKARLTEAPHVAGPRLRPPGHIMEIDNSAHGESFSISIMRGCSPCITRAGASLPPHAHAEPTSSSLRYPHHQYLDALGADDVALLVRNLGRDVVGGVRRPPMGGRELHTLRVPPGAASRRLRRVQAARELLRR